MNSDSAIEPWNRCRVLLTGGGGFLGRALLPELQARGPAELHAPRSSEIDLRDIAQVRQILERTRPHLVIHAAGSVGGIGANREHPGRFFYDNALMGLQLIEESRRVGVRKFVCIGTVCAYPKFTPVPFHEADLWNGYPEETNAPYGLAKKMLLVQLQAYRDEYGFQGIFLLPANLYGPDDNFDPRSSHVIPALIRKFVEARDAGVDHVVLWGDGSPTREFLYVDDAAAGILLATERYDSAEPMNLGTGEERSIGEVAAVVRELTGFSGRIEWDSSKPNGQPRRRLDVSRIQEIGFRPATSFDEGLRRTVARYLSRYRNEP